jgi:hypothetical protein
MVDVTPFLCKMMLCENFILERVVCWDIQKCCGRMGMRNVRGDNLPGIIYKIVNMENMQGFLLVICMIPFSTRKLLNSRSLFRIETYL